jgi:hypothetical protein
MRLLGIITIAIVVAVIAAHRRAAPHRTEPAGSGVVWSRSPAKSALTLASRPPAIAVRQKTLSTTDAHYDPVMYMQQEGGALDPKEIYRSEPRDSKFAPIFEKRLDTTWRTVLDELGLTKAVKAVHVDCKTLSCITTIEAAPGTDVRELYNDLNGIGVGDAQQPGMDVSDPDHPQVTIYNLYRPDSREDGKFQQIMDGGMRPALELVKQRLAKDKPDEAVH